MRPHALRYIPAEDITLFQQIKDGVNKIPDDLDLGNNDEGQQLVLSCHMLARAVGKVFKLHHCDGYYHSNFEHSWILTPSENIIDVYPIAVIGGPILIHNGFMGCPARLLYIPKRISRGRFDNSLFRLSVRILVSFLSKP